MSIPILLYLTCNLAQPMALTDLYLHFSSVSHFWLLIMCLCLIPASLYIYFFYFSFYYYLYSDIKFWTTVPDGTIRWLTWDYTQWSNSVVKCTYDDFLCTCLLFIPFQKLKVFLFHLLLSNSWRCLKTQCYQGICRIGQHTSRYKHVQCIWFVYTLDNLK